MKQGKIILIVLLLLVFSTAVFAQGIIAKGVKVGLNIATVTGDDVDDVKSKIGFAFGGFLIYEVNEVFSLQPELLFTMKGAKFEDEYTEEDYYEYYSKFEGSWNLNYLEIPVLAKLKIPMEGNIKPNVFLGPALGINISATYDTDYEYWVKDENGDIIEEDSGSDDGDIEDINKGVDFGLVFGAGAEFGQMSVDARYNLGLSSVSDDGDDDVKNSVISIMLGYSF